MPPTRLPTTGRARQKASTTTRPIPSDRDGNTQEQDGTLIVLKPRLMPQQDPPELAAYAMASVAEGRPSDDPSRFPHQSTADHWMPLRVLDEMARIWRGLQRQEPERRSLPPILCVVVHQGESGWTGPRRMQDLFEGPGADSPLSQE